MTNSDTREWHRVYREDLGDAERETVDAAWNKVAETLRQEGFKVANDDRAEQVVASITKLLVESNWTGGARVDLRR